MAWEPDRRSNFFFSPPVQLCAVTYMTEISLIVTLNNQFTYHELTTQKAIKIRQQLSNRTFDTNQFEFKSADEGSTALR